MSDDIVPDTKNWTWVLEKSCRDCGFVASTFDATTIGAALRDLGSRWRAVLGQTDATVRPRKGVWSPLEYGCHVRDVFRVFDDRVRTMLAELDPRFENWDQDRTAIEDDYRSQDPREVAIALAVAADALADRFDSVASNQWTRRGYRSDGAAFTVESIARYLMHDPVHHLWDVGADVPTY